MLSNDLTDLVLHCTKPRSSESLIQIWLNRGVDGFELSRTYDLPTGAGPLSLADMGRSVLPRIVQMTEVSDRPGRDDRHRFPHLRSQIHEHRYRTRLRYQHSI